MSCSGYSHTFFTTSLAQCFTWPDIALFLRKTSSFPNCFAKPSLCFTHRFLKFTFKFYPLLLTSVNNISMKTTMWSFQQLLSELCKLWWCLISWLWGKKVDIIYSGYHIWAYTSLYRHYLYHLCPKWYDMFTTSIAPSLFQKKKYIDLYLLPSSYWLFTVDLNMQKS